MVPDRWLGCEFTRDLFDSPCFNLGLTICGPRRALDARRHVGRPSSRPRADSSRQGPARVGGGHAPCAAWWHPAGGELLGPAVAAVLTGSLVVEKIFGVPGLGTEFIASAFDRDYNLVLGTVLVYGVMLIIANVLVDLAYGVIDPRIRQHG